MDLSACSIKDGFEIEKWQDNKQNLIRQFTVRTFDICTTLSLSIEDLVKMKFQYLQYFDELMNGSENRLRRAIELKN